MANAKKKKGNVWTEMGPKEKILRGLPQVPGTRKSLRRDQARKARAPGLRISKTGKKYWETRQNRSDQKGTTL